MESLFAHIAEPDGSRSFQKLSPYSAQRYWIKRLMFHFESHAESGL